MDGSALEKAGASVTPLNNDVLLQMLHQQDEKHEAAHERLRRDFEALEARVALFATATTSATNRVQRLEDTPADLSRSIIPTKIWLAMFGSTLTLVGIIIGAAYSVKSDVRDIATKQAAESRMSDERTIGQKQFNEDVKKALDMNRVYVESMRQELAKLQRR